MFSALFIGTFHYVIVHRPNKNKNGFACTNVSAYKRLRVRKEIKMIVKVFEGCAVNDKFREQKFNMQTKKFWFLNYHFD